MPTCSTSAQQHLRAAKVKKTAGERPTMILKTQKVNISTTVALFSTKQSILFPHTHTHKQYRRTFTPCIDTITLCSDDLFEVANIQPLCC